MCHCMRHIFIRQKIVPTNALRTHLTKFGIVHR